VARAANTGVSGFIRSDGSWYSLVGDSSDNPRAGGTGYQIAQLQVDPRVTFYSRYGDVFALACAGLTCLAIFDALGRGMRERRQRRSSGKAESK